MWQHSKTQIVTKLKNLNGDKTKNLKFSKKVKMSNCENLNNKYVTIPKLWENSNNDKIQNIKKMLCYKLKTLNMTTIRTSNCDGTQKVNLWQNFKTQIATKLEIYNYKNDKV